MARVAVLAPLTGEHAAAGQDVADGVRLAVEEWNAAGGVHGLHLELVTADGASADAVARIASDSRVVLSVNQSALPENRTRGTRASLAPPPAVLLDPMSRAGTSVAPVRLGPSPEQVADVAAAAVAFNFGQVGVAVVSSSSPEDVAAAAAFVQAAQRRGLRVRAEYTLADIEGNYTQAAGAVRSAAPQVLYVAGRGLDAGALWAEIRPRDSRIRLVLGPGALDEGFFRTAGGFLDGVTALELSPRPADVQGARGFISRFTARFGREPGTGAARAYDAATLGLRAIASTTDGHAPARDSVRVALATERELDGVMRHYTLADGAPVSWKLALYRLMPDGTPLLAGEPDVQ